MEGGDGIRAGDGQVHVVTAKGRILWRICSGGSCLVHLNLRVLMEAYRDLRISQGKGVDEQA
jgi:hypothetical protein